MLDCNTCKKTQPFESFSKGNNKHGLAHRCKACDRAYREANKEVIKEYQFQRLYGISSAEYNVMYEKQGGLCYICGNSCKTGRKLAVDHNHGTGKVRKLLCVNCNQGLGCFKDNPRIMQQAINYLKKYD